MEGYSPGNTDAAGYNCEYVVTQFLSGWSYEVQNVYGWKAGVYGSATSTIKGLVDYLSSIYVPYYIWPGGSESDWNVPDVPNSDWVYDQRAVQYRDNWTWNGYLLDSDCVVTGVNDGLSESVWDTGSYNDSGGLEQYSQTYDTIC